MGKSRVFNDDGIVVKIHDLGETDRIAVMLTKNHGLLSCVARGARSPKSRVGAHVDVLRCITFSSSKGRSEMGTFSQVETRKPFIGISKDLDRLMTAAHFAEICQRFTIKDVANPAIYDMLYDGLGHVELCEVKHLDILKLWFELHLMSESGLLPQLYICVRTGVDIEPGDHWFSPSEGGLVRRVDGEPVNPNGIYDLSDPMLYASQNTIKILRYIARTENWREVASLRCLDKDLKDALSISGAMLKYQQERGVGRAERVADDLNRRPISIS